MLPSKYHENAQLERETYISLKIGLNMLGEGGRAMLAQYIKAKLEQKDLTSYRVGLVSSITSLQVLK